MQKGTIEWWDTLPQNTQLAILLKWEKISNDQRAKYSLNQLNEDEDALYVMLNEVSRTMFGFDFI